MEGFKGNVCLKCGATRKDDQIGLEETPEEYVANLVEVFRELRRVLRDDGTCWLNLGDSYIGYKGANYGVNSELSNLQKKSKIPTSHMTGTPQTSNLKPKDLVGIPWRVAFALQADGWWLRSDIVWHKPNPMPESMTDRPTKAHEYIFLLTKSARYWYDQDAVRENFADDRMGNPGRYTPHYQIGSARNDGNQIGANGEWDGSKLGGRNKRTVWSAPETADPLLSYLLDKLAADDPERLIDYLDQYAADATLKSDAWKVATKPFKGAHFAVFPPKLIEPCILAGCPSRVCVECGTPWARVIQKITKSMPVEERHGRIGHNGQPPQISGNYWEGPTTKPTEQHRPQCQCCPLPAIHVDEFGHQWPIYNITRPGVVLDPFMGSGTTAAVAIQNKRDWLGIELNTDYIELAKDRIAKTQPALFTA
jgi:DNA modification methylase